MIDRLAVYLSLRLVVVEKEVSKLLDYTMDSAAAAALVGVVVGVAAAAFVGAIVGVAAAAFVGVVAAAVFVVAVAAAAFVVVVAAAQNHTDSVAVVFEI